MFHYFDGDNHVQIKAGLQSVYSQNHWSMFSKQKQVATDSSQESLAGLEVKSLF